MFYSPLKNSIYRAIWVATFFSNVGTWVHTVTGSLLMTKLTTSSTMIALVQTCTMLPLFIFSIPAGVIADLYNRKTIVICAQILMSLLAFCMAIVTYNGDMNAYLLLFTTFILNIGFAFNQPAWQALSSTLIPSSEIKQAAALNNLSFNLSRCIGPAIAGFYFSTLGPSFLFTLNGISFLGVIYAFLSKVKLSDNEKQSKISITDFVNGFKQALGFFQEFPSLKFIFLKSFLYFILASSLWATLPYIIIVYHHLSDKNLGVLTSAAGIGAVLNAYYIYQLRKFLTDAQLTTISLFLAAIVIFIFAQFYSFYLYFFFMLIFGFSWSLSVSVFNGILQSEFPKHTRSRLIGFYCVFFASAQALGSFLSGKAMQFFGLKPSLLFVSVATLLAGIFYLISNKRSIIFSPVLAQKEINNV